MKCNGCSTPMQLLRTEASARASTEWHRCPLCGKVRLTSAPQSARDAGFPEYPADEIYRAEAPSDAPATLFTEKYLYA